MKIPAAVVAILLTNNAFCQNSNELPSVDELKKLSMEQLLDIEVISVLKRPEKLTSASSAIQVITKDDIRHSGASNVAEALRLAPNLQVAQVNSSQWAISARGFNNVLANKLLVLIDGRVVYTPMYAGVFWDVQNLILEDVERIEVISGPGGTQWGSNAVNGVINIITKNSKDTHGLFAEGATGSQLRGLGSLRYGCNLGKNISLRAFGTAFRRNSVIYQDSVDAKDGWQMAQAGVRVDLDATENDQIAFQSNLYEGRPDPDGGNPIIAKGINVLGHWTRTLSEKSDFQIQTYYDQTWRDFRNDFTERLATYDIEGQHRFALGHRQELVYGLGIRLMDHDVKNLELFAFLPPRKSLYLYNAFLQDEISLIDDHLALSLGIKVEHNSYTGFQYQPSVRLNWHPATNQTIWAAISRATRNPARIDREFFVSLSPDFPVIVGNNFQSEAVIAYETGWRFQLKKQLSFSLATFYNVYTNIRSVEPGPAPFNLPLTFGNGVEGNSYGIELSASYKLANWWLVRGGYTYLKKDLSVKPESADQNHASAESNDPRNQAMMQSEMTFRNRIELGTWIRYIGRLPEPYVPDYVGLDVRVGWKLIKGIELNIVGQNLLQTEHVEFVPSSGVRKSIARSVYVKLVCRL